MNASKSMALMICLAFFIGFAGAFVLLSDKSAQKQDEAKAEKKASLDSTRRDPQTTQASKTIVKSTGDQLAQHVQNRPEGFEQNKDTSPNQHESAIPSSTAKEHIPARFPDGNKATSILEYQGEEFSLTLSYPRVEILEETFDSIRPDKERKVIIFDVSIRNRSERRILDYQPIDRQVLPNYVVYNDVGNFIGTEDPRVAHGLAKGQVSLFIDRIAGALPREMQPGEVLNDVYCCKLPPPKTQYLKLKIWKDIVTFNRSPCAKEDFEVKIPVTSIKNYAAR